MAHFFQDAGRNPGNSFLVVDDVERRAIGDLVIQELDVLHNAYTADDQVRLLIAIGAVLKEIDYRNLQGGDGYGIEVDEDFLWLAQRVLVSYVDECARPGLEEPHQGPRPSPESLGMSSEDREAIHADRRELWETQAARYHAVINVTEALRPALAARAVA